MADIECDTSRNRERFSWPVHSNQCSFHLAEDLSVTASILTSIGIHEPSFDDCYIIREVCKTVSLRASKLAAAGNEKLSRVHRSTGFVPFSHRCGDQSSEFTFGNSRCWWNTLSSSWEIQEESNPYALSTGPSHCKSFTIREQSSAMFLFIVASIGLVGRWFVERLSSGCCCWPTYENTVIEVKETVNFNILFYIARAWTLII